MNPTGAKLILHSGGLGDTVLMVHLARAIHAALGGELEVLGRGAYRPLESLVDCIHHWTDLETGGFHVLFNDGCEIPDRARMFLGRFDRVINLLPDDGNCVARQLARATSAEIFSVDPRPREDFSGHITAQWSRDLGQLDSRFESLRIPETTLFTSLASTQLPMSEVSRNLMISPGSGGRNKCWPLPLFFEVAAHCARQDRPISFVLGPAEMERLSAAELASLEAHGDLFCENDVGRLAAALSSADAVLANDSGIAHLAAAAGAPVTVIFGPTAPQRWRPIGRHVRTLNSAVGWPDPADVMRAIG